MIARVQSALISVFVSFFVLACGATLAPVRSVEPVEPVPSPAGRYVIRGSEPAPVRTSDPVILRIRALLAAGDVAKRAHKDDLKATIAFYNARSDATTWVTADGLSPRAVTAITEIRDADNWGLSAHAFDLPNPASGRLGVEDVAAAEIKVALAVLTYVRHARGGRVRPSRISRFLDQTPELKAPAKILNDISASDSIDAYLRAQHPAHEQFARLRKLLVEARGEHNGVKKTTAPGEDIKLPGRGPVLVPGARDKDVALLRARLNVPADRGDPKIYDDALVQAVRAFQKKNGIKVTGRVGRGTRAVLNGAHKKRTRGKAHTIQQLVINMERWRWMPRSMGRFHVWNNIPEFRTRVFKDGKRVFSEKIIVGKPKNPTPAFSADMKLVIFHPSWGVPNGIKKTEILPFLKQKTGFFGLGGADTRVLRQHNLTVTRNGRPVDASKINWSKVDIRNYHFSQPPSRTNVLGKVKFRFPNRHDVYMHDTPERHLFKKSNRTLSHGCLRVHNPKRLAEIILQEDKGWPAQRVGRLWAGRGNGTITLDTPVPVHISYMTAVVDDNGVLRTFGDPYGYNGRVVRALGAKPVARSKVASFEDDDGTPARSQTRPRRKKKVAKKKQRASRGRSVGDLISGQLMN